MLHVSNGVSRVNRAFSFSNGRVLHEARARKDILIDKRQAQIRGGREPGARHLFACRWRRYLEPEWPSAPPAGSRKPPLGERVTGMVKGHPVR